MVTLSEAFFIIAELIKPLCLKLQSGSIFYFNNSFSALDRNTENVARFI